MKVLVTGVAGQLGHDVMNELSSRSIEGVGTDLKRQYAGVQDGSDVTRMQYIPLDITDAEAVESAVDQLHPDTIVHCAAWTAVDLAEEESNIPKVRSVNVDGTRNIALAAKKAGAKMVYLSTDYVFDGQGTKPWDPDFKGYSPLNVYGKTKLEGELAVSSILDRYFIVRIAWVFGRNGNNFIKTMLKAGRNHSELRVVDDQIGTPTYTYDLASLLVDMIQTEKYGYYHATNSEIPEESRTVNGAKTGYISWYDFAKEIFRQAALLGYKEYDGDHLKVTPVSTEEYGLSKARRPFNSRLDKSKLGQMGFRQLPDWPDALHRYLEDTLPLPEL